jgi:hypothetical protein
MKLLIEKFQEIYLVFDFFVFFFCFVFRGLVIVETNWPVRNSSALICTISIFKIKKLYLHMMPYPFFFPHKKLSFKHRKIFEV